MTSQTTTLTAVQTELIKAHDEKIAAWTAEDEATATAVEARRAASPKSAAFKAANKDALSHGAKKANRKHEIRQLELDLRLEGVEFEPWTEPAPRVQSTRLLPLSQEEIETSLAKLRALAATGVPESVQHDIDVRVTKLLKAAEVRGYKVS